MNKVRFVSLVQTTPSQNHQQVLFVNPNYIESIRSIPQDTQLSALSVVCLLDSSQDLSLKLLIAQSIQHILSLSPRPQSWVAKRRFANSRFFAPLHRDACYYLQVNLLVSAQRGSAQNHTKQPLQGANPHLKKANKQRFSHLYSLDGRFWFHPLALSLLRFWWSKAWRSFLWLSNSKGVIYGLNSQFITTLMPQGVPAEKKYQFHLTNGEVYTAHRKPLRTLHQQWRKKQAYLLKGFTHEGLPVVVNPMLMSYVSCARHIMKDDRVVWRSHVTYLLKVHTDVLNLPLKQLLVLPFFTPIPHASSELRVFINLLQVSRIQPHGDGTLITFADDNLFMPCTQTLDHFHFLIPQHHFKLFHTPSGEEILVNLSHVRLARATLIEPNESIGTQLQFSKFYDTLDIIEPLDSLPL